MTDEGALGSQRRHVVAILTMALSIVAFIWMFLGVRIGDTLATKSGFLYAKKSWQSHLVTDVVLYTHEADPKVWLCQYWSGPSDPIGTSIDWDEQHLTPGYYNRMTGVCSLSPPVPVSSFVQIGFTASFSVLLLSVIVSLFIFLCPKNN
jgi:hypothetical protein